MIKFAFSLFIFALVFTFIPTDMVVWIGNLIPFIDGPAFGEFHVDMVQIMEPVKAKIAEIWNNFINPPAQ